MVANQPQSKDTSRREAVWTALRARRRSTLGSVLALCLAGVLIWLGTPLWWLGCGVGLAALVVLQRAWRQPLQRLGSWLGAERQVRGRAVVPGTLLLELFYVGVLVALASVMMWDIVGGERPVSHDHTVHYYKAWQLHQHFLSEGRLFGWSHRMFAGYPVNYLYPIGTDLWVNLVHAVTFGAFGFSRSYGIAFWAFHVLTGVAGYRFGRLLGGPSVGFITGLLMITDMGEFRLGGWAYTVNYGVWPQALSLCFALLALCHLPGIVERRGTRDVGWFGLWMGIAIITHPIQLIFMALLLVVVALAAPFSREVQSAGGIARLLGAYALAVFVSCIWLIPFLTLRGETTAMGIWWDSTYEMGKALVALELFPGSLALATGLGLLGVGYALRSGRFIVLVSALAALVIPAVSNATFIDEFHLPSLITAFTKVQFIRMSTMAKPFWFALAGCFVVAMLHSSAMLSRHMGQAHRGSKDTTARASMFALLVALLALPVVVPALQSFWTSHVAKSLRTVQDRDLLADRQQMLEWLANNLPDDGHHYRVGIFTGHNHDLFDTATLFDKPIYKRGFTPCSNFIYKMHEKDEEILRAVRVRFIMTKRFMRGDSYEELGRFGRYRVYRFVPWKPEPFDILAGKGQVSVERFEDEEIVLQAQPGATGTLRLAVSYFPRWHATRDGEPIRIRPTYLESAQETTGFMTVELKPGRYRFVFERSWKDRIGMLISALGVLVAFAMIWVERGGSRVRNQQPSRVIGWLDALSRPRYARARGVALAVVVVSLFGIAVGLAQWRPPIELEELDAKIARVRFDFLEELHRARVGIEYKDRYRGCRRQGDRFVCRDDHGNLDNEKYVASSPATIEEYTMVRCIRARPEDDALLSVRFRRLRLADAIVGYYGIERAGRLMKRKRPVNFGVLIGGRRAYFDHTRSDNKMHWFRVDLKKQRGKRADVTFTVDSPNVSKRYFCFYAQMVDLK